MHFTPLTLQELPLARPYLKYARSRICEFTAGTMFMWRNYSKMEYAVQDGAMYTIHRDRSGRTFYGLPLAEDTGAAISALLAEAKGAPLTFCAIPENRLPDFEAVCQVLDITEQQEFFDYLYRAEDLILLKGKKYGGQRNHISQFKRNAAQWSFTEITPENVSLVKDFFRDYDAASPSPSGSELAERQMVSEVLEKMDIYRMLGGVLQADGKIVGFSLGEVAGDTLFVHIEKADRTFRGAYQMLVNQFAARFAGEGVSYINREDDMGDPGLRTSKLSYHPITLLKKYCITVK